MVHVLSFRGNTGTCMIHCDKCKWREYTYFSISFGFVCWDSCTLPDTVIPRLFNNGFSSNSCCIFVLSSVVYLSAHPFLWKSSCLSSCVHVGLSDGSRRSDHCKRTELERGERKWQNQDTILYQKLFIYCFYVVNNYS